MRETKMKSIICNTEMVRAILEGRKTQFRRVIIPQPKLIKKAINERHNCYEWKGGMYALDMYSENTLLIKRASKYQVGDILYAKETFIDDYAIGGGDENGNSIDIIYKADSEDKGTYPHWKPSVHLKQKDARIFLKVTNVRIERLQDISDKDCIKEGISEVDFYPDDGFPLCSGYMIGKDDGKTALSNTPQKPFSKFWNSTLKFHNGVRKSQNNLNKYSWEDNPYVFVYEFEKVER